MADPTKVTAFRTLRGHTASVQSVAAHPSGDMVSFICFTHAVVCIVQLLILTIHTVVPILLHFYRCVLVLGIVESICGKQRSPMTEIIWYQLRKGKRRVKAGNVNLRYYLFRVADVFEFHISMYFNLFSTIVTLISLYYKVGGLKMKYFLIFPNCSSLEF